MAEMHAGAEGAIRKVIVKESAIYNIVDHYFDIELRHFLSDITEDTSKESFFDQLEDSILHSLFVLRYEDQANEMMEKLWYDQVEKYETRRVEEQRIIEKRAYIVKVVEEYRAQLATKIQQAWRKHQAVVLAKASKA